MLIFTIKSWTFWFYVIRDNLEFVYFFFFCRWWIRRQQRTRFITFLTAWRLMATATGMECCKECLTFFWKQPFWVGLVYSWCHVLGNALWCCQEELQGEKCPSWLSYQNTYSCLLWEDSCFLTGQDMPLLSGMCSLVSKVL